MTDIPFENDTANSLIQSITFYRIIIHSKFVYTVCHNSMLQCFPLLENTDDSEFFGMAISSGRKLIFLAMPTEFFSCPTSTGLFVNGSVLSGFQLSICPKSERINISLTLCSYFYLCNVCIQLNLICKQSTLQVENAATFSVTLPEEALHLNIQHQQ